MTRMPFLDFGGVAPPSPEHDLAAAFAGLMRELHLRQGGAAEAADAVARAAFAVSLAASAGHSCIDIGELDPPVVPVDALRESPVVVLPEAGEPCQPLVLEGDRLYLQRYWDYECRLAGRLIALNQPIGPAGESPQTEALLERFFPVGGPDPDWQKLAVVTALRRRLAIVSGGPGTGKTTTVVKLLAVLLSLEPELRVALAAPTGKAAARMQEAIRTQCERLGLEAALRRRFPDTAFTLHRLLGSVRGSIRFRHGARNPLPLEVVIVDEASMLDVALATKLVEALAPRARLVLLGDKDQLASVETGAVFAQLAGTRTRLAAAEGVDAGGVSEAVVWLEHSYRFAAGTGIGRLAQCINAGDAQGALSLLDAAEHADVCWADVQADPRRGLHFTGYDAYLDAVRAGASPATLIELFERHRILCAVREGPRGARHLNEAMEERLRAELRVPAGQAWYPGRPVLVTRNEPVLRIYNGDIGIAAPDAQGNLLVHFTGGDGAVRSLAPARLPACETAFAMTVHKAQGSEFDHVDLVLPDADSRVLTRELLYTALTRARAGVVVYGSPEVFAAAAGRRTHRLSGLAERLGISRQEQGFTP